MFLVAIFLLSWFVQLLWNALIPDLFHGPVLNYWQAVGLLVLTRILVGIRGRRGFLHGLWHWKKWGGPWSWKRKGWRWEDAMFGPGHHGSWKNKSEDYCGPWFGKWEEWNNMSPEERQQAKEEWKRKKEEWKAAWKSKSE